LDALLSELLPCLLALLQIKAHRAQNLWRFRKLQVGIFDDLHAISPRVEEIKEASLEKFCARSLGELAHGRAIVHDEAEVPVRVSMRSRRFGQRNELIAHINEGMALTSASQRELKNLAVESERLLHVSDFERNVIDADKPGPGGSRIRSFAHQLTPPARIPLALPAASTVPAGTAR
jgi:hypothetical protein